MPIHVRAERGDIAPIALLAGDPGRTTRIAGLLEGARCYNDHRGLLGYTGTFEGVEVSAQATGMGGPSAAIVTEELAHLGATTVIRVGTCGAIAPRVGVLDLVIATAAVPFDGTSRQYLGGDPFAPVADVDVTQALVAAASASNRTAYAGLILSEDGFYAPTDWQRWRARGVLAVEMEAAAIFTVAHLRGLRAGCICLAVNDVEAPAHEPTPRGRDEAELDLIRVALHAATRLRE